MAKPDPGGRKFRTCRKCGHLRCPTARARNPARHLAAALFGAGLIFIGSFASLPQARADAPEWWALGTFLQPLHGPGQDAKAGGADLGRQMNKAEELRRTGRDLEALKMLNALAGAHPVRPEVFWRRGELHMAMGADRQALADFATVAKLSPDAVGAHMKRGLLLARTNRDSEALKAYEQAIAAAKRHHHIIAEYWKAYASANEESPLVGTTLSLLRRDRDRTIADARLGQGQVHFARSRYEAASRAYSEAIDALPGYGLAYRYRGWLSEKTGRVRSARADYRRALEIDATDAWTQKALQRVR